MIGGILLILGIPSILSAILIHFYLKGTSKISIIEKILFWIALFIVFILLALTIATLLLHQYCEIGKSDCA